MAYYPSNPYSYPTTNPQNFAHLNYLNNQLFQNNFQNNLLWQQQNNLWQQQNNYQNNLQNNYDYGHYNSGFIHNGSTYSNLGSTFNNSPAVQTFGNVAPGSVYGVTQNVSYVNPPSYSSPPPVSYPSVPSYPSYPSSPTYQYQPAPTYSFPAYQPQQYYMPQPGYASYPAYPPYPRRPDQGGGITAGLLQTLQMIMMMFLQNGSFTGPGFRGERGNDCHHGHHRPRGPRTREEIIEEVIETIQNVNGNGRVHGDPHFVGGDGENYDVMGEPGKVYNMLSDKNFQFNALFDTWNGKADATIVATAGFVIAGKNIKFDKGGALEIDGKPPTEEQMTALQSDQGLDLGDGNRVKLQNGTLTVTTKEYEVVLHDKTDHLDFDLKTIGEGAGMDGVLPHGLWGQTVDADTEARNGDQGAGAQGGGTLETVDENGNVVVSQQGDRTAHQHYEMTDLFDTGGNERSSRFVKYNARPNTTPKTGVQGNGEVNAQANAANNANTGNNANGNNNAGNNNDADNARVRPENNNDVQAD